MKKIAIAGLGLILGAGLAGLVAAADDASQKSVTGTLEDSFCYGLMDAKGASHKKCATECAKQGTPVSLVDSSGKIYVVLPAKNAQPLPDDVLAKMEDKVTITGKEFSKGGVNFITAESVK